MFNFNFDIALMSYCITVLADLMIHLRKFVDAASGNYVFLEK